MITTLASLFGALAGCLLLAAAVHDRVAYAPLRRAVRRRRLDPSLAEQARTWMHDSMGSHPEATYRYLPYEVPRGQTATLDGVLSPGASFFGIGVYDRWMQSSQASGPTFLEARALAAGPDGSFSLTLAHADPGGPWLDVSSAPRGVLLERHLGEVPAGVSRLRTGR